MLDVRPARSVQQMGGEKPGIIFQAEVPEQTELQQS